MGNHGTTLLNKEPETVKEQVRTKFTSRFRLFEIRCSCKVSPPPFHFNKGDLGEVDPHSRIFSPRVANAIWGKSVSGKRELWVGLAPA